jgi:hypothetical protein
MSDLYRELIDEALSYEEGRRAVHNTLGLGVVSASGALTSFTLAIATFLAVRSEPSLIIPPVTRALLVASTFILAVAAMLALLGILPGVYYGMDAEYLRRKVTREGWNVWDAPVTKADWEYEARRIEFLEQAHNVNSRRGIYLRFAVMAEVSAIATMAGGVIVLFVR